MSWLQLKIHTEREDAEALEDALMEVGAVSVTLEDDADQPILEPGLGETPLWDQVQLTGLFEADVDKNEVDTQLAAIVGTPLPDYRWEALEEKDWEREWMGQYHPIRCGERLWICPSWIDPPEPDKINILLDPGLAFGTGTHPTTFLCMQWLDTQPLAGKNLIDYGCGSGILGIAALKLGASHVDGVDIDSQALTATEENARRNGLDARRMPVYLPEEAPAEPADVVLANILAGPLVELAGTMADLTRPGGRICLSGILSHQAEEVMDAYERWFSFDPVAEQDDWVRLSATRLS